MKKQPYYSDFTEAFLIFLTQHCVPYLEGGGTIGGYNPSYANSDIRIVLRENGSGHITLLGDDSQVQFKTIDHYRSQGMITPEQQERINQLTSQKATKQVREGNKILKQRIAVLEEKFKAIYQQIVK